LLTFYFVDLLTVDFLFYLTFYCWLAIFAGFHRNWVCLLQPSYFPNLLISPAHHLPEAEASSPAAPSSSSQTWISWLTVLIHPPSSSSCHSRSYLMLLFLSPASHFQSMPIHLLEAFSCKPFFTVLISQLHLITPASTPPSFTQSIVLRPLQKRR
jgi:hypothetical protein